ncbi:MAG: mechanosensitive ion channel domain-containing protein [Candidatus Zixiibacteriota bacterium]
MDFEQILVKLQELSALYGLKVVGAIAILIIGRLVVGAISRLVRKLLEKSNVEETLTRFITSLTRIALLTFVVIAALNTLGVQTASFVAVIGAAGLAVGFALQGSLSNFASGVMLIIFKPLKRGELVEAAGTLGVVKEIHIFNTILRTLDNKRVIIPNSKVTGDIIVNYSAEGILRVDMVFGISYGDHIPKAKELLENILKENPKVLAEPAYTVAVSELGNSSVNFVVRPYVKVEDYWDVYFGVTEKVKMTFDENSVTIPFPQRDIHFYQTATTT